MDKQSRMCCLKTSNLFIALVGITTIVCYEPKQIIKDLYNLLIT